MIDVNELERLVDEYIAQVPDDEEEGVMLKLDITNKVKIGLNDGDMLPLERCVCGEEFEPWTFNLYSDPLEEKAECPSCKRKIWFELTIKVFQELREEDRSSNRPLTPYNRPISDEALIMLSGGFPEGVHDE